MSGHVGSRPFSPEELATCLRYENGRLYWRERADLAEHLNRKLAGQPAYLRRNSDGYHFIKVMGRHVAAHRAIWTVCKGVWPEGVIDHINRVRTDNRIENLRDVSHRENVNNREIRKPVAGIHFRPGFGWRARFWIAGRSCDLGVFQTEGEAIAARLGAERLFDTLEASK